MLVVPCVFLSRDSLHGPFPQVGFVLCPYRCQCSGLTHNFKATFYHILRHPLSTQIDSQSENAIVFAHCHVLTAYAVLKSCLATGPAKGITGVISKQDNIARVMLPPSPAFF